MPIEGPQEYQISTSTKFNIGKKLTAKATLSLSSSTIQCNTVLYVTVLYRTDIILAIQYNTVHYCTLLLREFGHDMFSTILPS